MHFSASNRATRYSKAELHRIKDSKSARSVPLCVENIRRLDILKAGHSGSMENYEQKIQAFRNLLPSFSANKLDATWLEFLNNYHNSLLNPQFEYTSNGKARKSFWNFSFIS